MPTYRQRGGRWQVQVRLAGRAPRSATFDTKAEARDWARSIEAEVVTGRSASTESIDGLIRRYIEEVGRLKPFGRTKLASLAKLRADLGRRRLSRLSTQDIVEYAGARRTEGAGPVTIALELSYLGTVLKTARALWRLQVPVAVVNEARDGLAMVGLVGRSTERTRRPTQAEVDALCSHWRANPRQTIPMADIVEFAIAAGLRREEICRIRWADLDVERRTVWVRDRKHPREKKGNDERVPLLDATGYDALAIIQRQRRRGERIFPYRPESISMAFQRAIAELGIPDLHFHDLRHEAVSRLFEAGLPIEHVALVSGHRDWRSLKRYTTLQPETVIARLDGLRGRPATS